MNFTERSPIESGFAAVFDTQIKPQLIEFEFERKAVLRRTYLQMAALLAVGVAIMIAGNFVAYGEYLVPALIFGGALGLGGAYMMHKNACARWTSKIKDAAMPAICDHVGDLTYSASGSGFSLSAMENMRLLPKYDNAYRRALMRGTHNGSGFEMVHTTLTETHYDNENRRRTHTVFRGLLFRIDMPTPAPGQIVLMRDRGKIGNKLAEKLAFGSTRSLPKVSFDDGPFEAAFEVYATQPEAAQTYLSGALRAALLRIGSEQGNGAKGMVAGFERGSFYIALERSGSFMTMGSLTTPVHEIEEDLHGIFDDIAISHQVIDRLHTALDVAA